MKVDFLPWDSDFFGCRIARAEVADAADFDTGKLDPYDLVYIFTLPNSDQSLEKKLQDANAVLRDTKVVLQKKLSLGQMPTDDAIRRITEESPELQLLALTSGWCSRFHQDPRLLPKYRELYTRWMSNYLIPSPQVATFAAFQNGVMAGMINCGVDHQQGKIGLLAVQENFRGQGIAGKLLNAADVFCARQGALNMEVTTQMANVSAVKAYLKAGYQILSKTNIWHWWKK